VICLQLCGDDFGHEANEQEANEQEASGPHHIEVDTCSNANASVIQLFV